MPSQPAPPPQKIMTKDPDYAASLNEPEKLIDEWSPSYQSAKQQVEDGIASITDADLKQQRKEQLESNLLSPNYDRFRSEARANFIAARKKNFGKHRNDWFEIGHIERYVDGTLYLKEVGASPLKMVSSYSGSGGGNLNLPVNLPTMDSIYAKFDSLEKDTIDNAKAGARSQASERWSMLNDLNAQGIGSPAPDPLDQMTAKFEAQALQEVREERLLVVGQGDLTQHRIDRVMLVDYPSETIMRDFGNAIKPKDVSWRFNGTTGESLEKEASLEKKE